MDSVRISGHRSSIDLISDKSTNSTLLQKATHIFVRALFLMLHLENSFAFLSVNIDSRPGACGFYSLIIPRALGSVLVRFDQITMDPIRNEKTKLCVRCKTGERGLLLGMISKSLLHAFDGYVNNASGTKKKIIEDIYKKGDRAFNTGSNVECFIVVVLQT